MKTNQKSGLIKKIDLATAGTMLGLTLLTGCGKTQEYKGMTCTRSEFNRADGHYDTTFEGFYDNKYIVAYGTSDKDLSEKTKYDTKIDLGKFYNKVISQEPSKE
jgi:major membrane immunogen (membrane-anchored lipoprotein)